MGTQQLQHSYLILRGCVWFHTVSNFMRTEPGEAYWAARCFLNIKMMICLGKMMILPLKMMFFPWKWFLWQWRRVGGRTLLHRIRTATSRLVIHHFQCKIHSFQYKIHQHIFIIHQFWYKSQLTSNLPPAPHRIWCTYAATTTLISRDTSDTCACMCSALPSFTKGSLLVPRTRVRLQPLFVLFCTVFALHL